MTKLERKLQQISDILQDELDDDDRAQLNDRLTTLQRRVGRFRSDEDYISFIESGLGRAKAIRDGAAHPDTDATADPTDWQAAESVSDVDWSRVPLCGCGSPTCDLKRGELPSACRDRSGGLLDPRPPRARVRTYAQRHTQPYVLRVVHRTWVEGYDDLLADAQETLSLAKQKSPERGRSSVRTAPR
jgi:hypothetical protein